MQKRVAVLGALACALALFSGARAQAAYNYQTTLSITSASPGVTIAANGLSATINGVTITLTNESRTGLTTASSLNVGDVVVTVAPGTPSTNFSIAVTDIIGITNTGVGAPGGSAGNGSLTTTDTINLANVANTGGVVSGSITDTGQVAQGGSSTVIGGVTFAFAPTPAFSFSNVTANGSGGNLGANVTPSAVPAPASLVMFGLGIGALGVIRLRRRFLSA